MSVPSATPVFISATPTKMVTDNPTRGIEKVSPKAKRIPPPTNLPARQAMGTELRNHLRDTGLCGAAEVKLRDADSWLSDHPGATAVEFLDYLARAEELYGHRQLSDSTVLRAGRWIFGDEWQLADRTALDLANTSERQEREIKKLREDMAQLEAENLRLKRELETEKLLHGKEV